MKLVKKITAAATALVMAVGMMSFGASAATPSSWQTYKLYMYTGMPSGFTNVTSITIGESKNPVYTISQNQRLKIRHRKTSMTADYVSVTGKVWNGSGWAEDVIKFNHYKEDVTEKSENEFCPHAAVGSPARLIINLGYTGTNKDANCQAIAE